MATLEKELGTQARRGIATIEIVGLVLVVLALVGLFFKPGAIAGAFDAMINKVMPIVVKVYLTGILGVAVILSVITGRVLERLGFTDALIRIFAPITRWIGVNPTVIIPAVYNILGDINAAGRICGPTLKKAGATKDEQKIAVATMVQSQQSFSTFMLGLLALSLAGVKAFPIIVVAIFLPLAITPLLLKFTIYRDTKSKQLAELPTFTPNTGALPTLFGAAREGAELVFLLLIPAAAVIFAIIGLLEYAGIWKPIETALTSGLQAISVEPKTGILAVLASPTLAMATLKDMAATTDPRLVVGSFVLAASGLPLQVIFGQIPAVWTGASELSHTEAMGAAIVGMVLKIITAFLVAVLLTPLVI